MNSTHRKPGRPAAAYRASDGTIYPGLSRLGDGRWRISGPPRITFTEPDERLAIARYRRHQDKQAGQGCIGMAVSLPVVSIHNPELSRAVRYDPAAGNVWDLETPVDSPTPESTVDILRQLPAEVLWAYVREQIISRPQWVAERVGIEQIGYLSNLAKPAPSPTLEAVGRLHADRTDITKDWRDAAAARWGEFVRAVGVSTLREVDQDAVLRYRDMVRAAAAQRKSPATYTRKRFTAVKSILSYPPREGKWSADCAAVLAMCKVLVRPGTEKDPRPISREDFQKLLTAADPMMRAVLLLGLNCAMYSGEVAALNWSEIDLEAATLVTRRPKTSITRIATLWPETIAALQALPRGKIDALFITGHGRQHDARSIYVLWRRLRNAVDLVRVQFDQLRDGGYSAAIAAGADLTVARLLAGHACGMADHYVRRNPKMVAPACEAIYSHYMA